MFPAFEDWYLCVLLGTYTIPILKVNRWTFYDVMSPDCISWVASCDCSVLRFGGSKT